MEHQFDHSKSSFVTGAPVQADCGWVVMTMDELDGQDVDHSAILWFEDGAFYSICLQMFHSKHVAWLAGQGQAVAVGVNGECCVVNREGQFTKEFVTQSARNPRNAGQIRAATQLGPEVIAVGMRGQVYRRSAEGNWTDMMQGLPIGRREIAGFECVLAVASDEIYAAGWDGALWRFDGERWRRINSPTDRIISSLCLGADGQARGCGLGGLLIEGRGDVWRAVRRPAVSEDVWSIAATGESCLISSLRNLYRWEGQGIDLVGRDETGARSFGLLRADGDLLWAFGQKDLISLVDGRWVPLARGASPMVVRG
jgi:hypothetical protein